MLTESHHELRPNAWLLDFGNRVRAAVGTRVLLHVIDEPILHTVPCTPAYCRSVISWQGQLLPVMDIAAILDEGPQTPLLLAIAAYQDRTENITHFGALLLSAPPTAIAIADMQSCPLPENPVSWSKFAISCFNYRDEAIPVLNLARIFSLPVNHTRMPAHNSMQTVSYSSLPPT